MPFIQLKPPVGCIQGFLYDGGMAEDMPDWVKDYLKKDKFTGVSYFKMIGGKSIRLERGYFFVQNEDGGVSVTKLKWFEDTGWSWSIIEGE